MALVIPAELEDRRRITVATVAMLLEINGGITEGELALVVSRNSLPIEGDFAELTKIVRTQLGL